MSSRILWVLCALVLSVHASLLTLQNPRITVFNSAATQQRSEQLSLTQKLDIPVKLEQTDVLKLTFQVVEKDSSKGIQPHQTFLRFYDEKTGEEGIQPVRVTPGGKAKFELNLAKPPLSLPPTTDQPLKVSLIIGSSLHSPLSVELFDLVLPPSQPAPIHPDEASFHPLPEIKHTFRPEQKLPPRPVSAFFSAVVLAPWIILLGLWANISPRTPHLFSLSILPFILSLGAFEGLLFMYWVNLKLGEVLLYGAILSVFTFFAGIQALSNIGSRRLSNKK